MVDNGATQVQRRLLRGRLACILAGCFAFVGWQRYAALRLVLHVVHRIVLFSYKIAAPDVYTKQRSTRSGGEAVITLPSRELCAFLQVVQSFPNGKDVQVKYWFQVQKIICPLLRGPERIYRIWSEETERDYLHLPQHAYKVQWPGLEYLKEIHGIVLYVHGNIGPGLSKTALANADFVAKISRMCAVPVHLSEYAIKDTLQQGIDECMHYYTWLRLMYPGKKLCLVGDGIGCGVILAFLKEVEEGPMSSPDGVVFISPQLLPRREVESLWEAISVDKHETQPIPAFLDFAPPFYITVAKEEVLYEDALHIASSVRSDGAMVTLEVNNFGVHNYPMFEAYATEYAESLFRLCEFLKSIFFSEELRQEQDLEELTIGRITPRFVSFDDT